MKTEKQMNFKAELAKKTERMEEVIRKYLPKEEGYQENHIRGYELQYFGRREKTPPYADGRNLSFVRR